jgi:hypothetical protein
MTVREGEGLSVLIICSSLSKNSYITKSEHETTLLSTVSHHGCIVMWLTGSKNKHVVRFYGWDVTVCSCFPTFGSNLAVSSRPIERKALHFFEILRNLKSCKHVMINKWTAHSSWQHSWSSVCVNMWVIAYLHHKWLLQQNAVTEMNYSVYVQFAILKHFCQYTF